MEQELKKNRGFQKLCKSLAEMKNKKEIASLLRDVATFSELMDMSERLEVAQLVKKGIPYRTIAEKNGSEYHHG